MSVAPFISVKLKHSGDVRSWPQTLSQAGFMVEALSLNAPQTCSPTEWMVAEGHVAVRVVEDVIASIENDAGRSVRGVHTDLLIAPFGASQDESVDASERWQVALHVLRVLLAVGGVSRCPVAMWTPSVLLSPNHAAERRDVAVALVVDTLRINGFEVVAASPSHAAAADVQCIANGQRMECGVWAARLCGVRGTTSVEYVCAGVAQQRVSAAILVRFARLAEILGARLRAAGWMRIEPSH